MKGEFLGDTKGNRDLPPSCSANKGGSGENHGFKGSKYAGKPTKGNRDLPPNRTAGVSSGHGGGPHKAGG